MPKLRIDQFEMEVARGTTVLQAARTVGIEIPNLCYLDGCKAQTSCLACVVKINGVSRLVPSCATVVADGMVVESETEDVRSARRTALELLLSDHAGDCMAPCQGVCPAHLDIPKMVREIDAGELEAAAVTARTALVMPATLGRICPQLCEKGCRRTQFDSAVAICALHRHAADYDLGLPIPWLPEKASASDKRVAIIGAGPAGLAAAWELLQLGHECVIFDQNPEPGGALRYSIAPEVLPRDVLDAEIQLIVKLGAQLRMNMRLGKDITIDVLQQNFDAVLLAIGQVDKANDSALGVELSKEGIKADQRLMTTSLPGVFAAGSAIIPLEYAVRAVAQGFAASHAIQQYLLGQPVRPREVAFTSRLGKMTEPELASFFSQADETGRQRQGTFELTQVQADAEAHRCMSCDCSSLQGCKLRNYAIKYEAKISRFRRPRHNFERITTHPFVIYEPGKCIACGLCVQITEQAAEPLGLTYIGRGFEMRIDVPFNAKLEEALQKTAKQCVDACPTGAIAMKHPLNCA